MTEAALSSQGSLIQYLKVNYDLRLNSSQKDTIGNLIEDDPSFLRSALYKLEDSAMKRKSASQQYLERERAKRAFLDDIDEKAEVDTYEDAHEDTYEFDHSFNEKCLQIESGTLSASQNGHSAGGSDTTSAKSTPATSNLTTPSLTPVQRGVDAVILGEAKELLRLLSVGRISMMPFWAKYIVTFLITHRIISWTDLYPHHMAALGFASDEPSISASIAQIKPGADAYISKESREACLELLHEQRLLASGSEYLQEQNWFGGKVRLAGTIHVDQDEVKIKMQPPMISTSCRFTRKFGSHRFLRLTLPNNNFRNADKDAVLQFISGSICIIDCYYRVFHVKEGKSAYTFYLFQIGSDIPTVWELYDWHSPWRENSDALLCKHLSRIALGLSTSIPGVYIPARNVRYLPDIISPTGAVMTDGASPISQAAMRKIHSSLQHQRNEELPSAIQGRYNGAKGIWYISPEADENIDEVWIGIRPSQQKFQRDVTTEDCLQTLDVLTTSRSSLGSSIGKQILPILTCNGVPHSSLMRLQQRELEQFVLELLGELEDPKDDVELARALATAGNIYRAKARRLAPHLALARGMTSRAAQDFIEEAAIKAAEDEEDISESDEGGDTLKKSTSRKVPLSFCEKAYAMLGSGFLMKDNEVLRDFVVRAAVMFLDRRNDKIKVVIERSAEVIMIPDPLGVLEEGEIQLRFGRNAPIDPLTKIRITELCGEVLVTRLPCLIPTDIRKVIAVVHQDLSLYKDVVLFSTKGDRPLADLLSGGDYDGDVATVIWEPELVTPFQNASISSNQPGITLDDAFDRDVRKVRDLVEGRLPGDDVGVLDAMIRFPLVSMNKKGALGNLHLAAAYNHGYESKEAIDLAFKFNNSMDGVKTGYSIKNDILRKDRDRFDRELPLWAGQKMDIGGCNRISARRNRDLGRFIMDDLEDNIRNVIKKLKIQLDKRRGVERLQRDAHLAFIWEEAIAKNQLTEEQQISIMEYCKEVLKRHSEARSEYGRGKSSRNNSMSPQKKMPNGGTCKEILPSSLALDDIPVYFDRWSRESNWFCRIANLPITGLSMSNEVKANPIELLDIGQIDRLRKILASCLYVQSRKEKQDKVAIEIAWSTLLQIKAEGISKKNKLISVEVYPESTAGALRLSKH